MKIQKKARSIVSLTTVQLRMLCDQADKLRFFHVPSDKFWNEVDPDGIHVVTICLVHRPCLYLWQGVDHPWDFTHGGGKNIRAEVMCKMLGTMTPCYLICDFDYDAYMTLVTNARSKSRRNRRKKLAATR